MTKTFWNIWSSYGAFYFGRVNLSIVIPVLLATYEDLSLYSVGMVTTGFMISYAAGQFLHGQLSERFNPFVYVAVGLTGSAVMNLVLGFSSGFFFALLIGEIIDGGFQSMGWSSTVRANAYTTKDPEKTSTVLGTAYQVGNSLAWVASGFVIGQFGWEWGFWLATIVMLIRAVTLYLTKPQFSFQRRRIREQAKLTVSPPIFFSGISLCLLNMVRYGVISWIPTYLYREVHMPIEKVGLNIFLIPLAGIVGTLMYNRIRLPKDMTTMVYMILLGAIFIVFPHTTGLCMLALLVGSGLLIYGPHVFLVSTMPSRFHDDNVVAAATGFIDGWGYIGSAAIGMLVPFMLDLTGSWDTVFYFWAVVSFPVAFIVLAIYLWVYKR